MNRTKKAFLKIVEVFLFYVLLMFLIIPKGFAEEYIEIDGSSTVFPITEVMISSFKTEYTNVNINARISGTGGGFKKFCKGETTINEASRSIKSSEVTLCQKNNINYIKVLVAYDGIAVVVNPKNNWMNHITTKELQSLWGEKNDHFVKEWAQINSKWPERLIRLYAPGTDSGTHDYFCSSILGKGKNLRKDYISSEDDDVIIYGVMTDKYAIGFTGLSYYLKNQKQLKVLAVDNENGEGAVYPTQNTISNKKYLPLSRPLYLYVNAEKFQKDVKLRQFIQYYLTQAPEVVGSVGYVSLSSDQYKKELEKISSY